VTGFDVVVVGEPLVELHSSEAVRDGSSLRLSFSGDALNAAAAAAAAGARTAILTIIGDDDLGDALLERLDTLGIESGLIRRSARPNGAYLVVSDPSGERQFLYWRTGSAASALSGDDIERHRADLEASRALIVSGITAALSPSCEDAVVAAARLVSGAGGDVTYDPNFRARLTTPEQARRVLGTVAPLSVLMTPSCPGDTEPLLQTTDPDEAIRLSLALGAKAVAVTAGAAAVIVGTNQRRFVVDVPPAPAAVDATGAGDVVTGTATARLALGDDLETALRVAVAAASLSTTGRGGTGYVPTLEESRRLAGRPLGPVTP
jgi:2-dehydro-3-deoxygluconokinase